jgi:hypothetical protein
MAEIHLILKRDESVPFPNKIDQEIASAINTAHFHQQVPPHIGNMNTRRNASCAIPAHMQQNGTQKDGSAVP